jgi:hypothetical protein
MKRILLILITLLITKILYPQVLVYMDQNIPIKANEVSVMEVSKDGRFVAIGLKKGGKIILWDLTAKRQLHELIHGSSKSITTLLYSILRINT